MTIFFGMRTVFYYCQSSSNIAAPDRARGKMWRAESLQAVVRYKMELCHDNGSSYFQLYFLFQISVPYLGFNSFVSFFNKAVTIYTLLIIFNIWLLCCSYMKDIFFSATESLLCHIFIIRLLLQSLFGKNVIMY